LIPAIIEQMIELINGRSFFNIHLLVIRRPLEL